MRAVSAARMREIDRRAREEFGIPELVLMEHAGKAAAKLARRLYSRSGRARSGVVVLAGGGANGGDGFVAARHLDNWNVPVSVVLLADPARVRAAADRGGTVPAAEEMPRCGCAAAGVNLGILRRMGVPVEEAPSLSAWRGWVRKRVRPAVVVDALLGTGASGRVREPVASAIAWINRQRCRVVSVDLPSGLCADTGLPCGAAVRAVATVTFGLPKIGLLRGRGKDFSGRVTVAEISLPRALLDE